MSVLSDRTIKEQIQYHHDPELFNEFFRFAEGSKTKDDFIGITPYDESNVQPCSLDVRLGDEVIFYPHETKISIPEDSTYRELFLDPLEFCLGHTLEYVSIPNNILCTISGKSSLGRQGLCIHATAGLIDPGFKGQITLELFNMSSKPIKLTSSMLIAQLSFQYLDFPAERCYGSTGLGSHYQGQTGATPSYGI